MAYTLRFSNCMTVPKLAVAVDLPTPPLVENIATIFTFDPIF